MARRVWFVIVAVLAAPALVSAQTPGAAASSRIAWSQAAPDLASAQSYAIKFYADGATTGQPLAGVTCTGASSPFQCVAPFPAFTPGNHSLQLTATITVGGVTAESARSAVISFQFVVAPATPANLSIQ